jgi:hypothetical protein
MSVLFGGVETVIIEEAGGDWATPLLTMADLTEEGNTWPVPETVTAGVHGGQQGPTGERTPFVVQGINVDATAAETVRQRGLALQACDVRFVSKDGNVTRTLYGVLVSVATAGIVEHGQYGFVRISGTAVSSGAAKSYTDS